MTQEKANSVEDLTVEDTVSIVNWLLAGEPSGRPGGHPEFNKLAPHIPTLITHLARRLGIYENAFQKLFFHLNNAELEHALCARGRLLPALFDTNKPIARLSECFIIETLHGLSLKDDTRYDVLSVLIDREAKFDSMDILVNFAGKLQEYKAQITQPEMYRTETTHGVDKDTVRRWIRKEWVDWYIARNGADRQAALTVATEALLDQYFPDGTVPADVKTQLTDGEEVEVVLVREVVSHVVI